MDCGQYHPHEGQEDQNQGQSIRSGQEGQIKTPEEAVDKVLPL
jgi:hypothetical protein